MTHPVGFNEPDHSGSYLKPQDAAERWPMMEEVADALNLSVVSPCVRTAPHVHSVLPRVIFGFQICNFNPKSLLDFNSLKFSTAV